jgi:hypothetical protein
MARLGPAALHTMLLLAGVIASPAAHSSSAAASARTVATPKTPATAASVAAGWLQRHLLPAQAGFYFSTNPIHWGCSLGGGGEYTEPEIR